MTTTTTRPPSTAYEPPPYSWTRLPTLKGNGVSSAVRPSSPWRSSVFLPPSVGLVSSQ